MLTQSRLKELFHYDPETGFFTRIHNKQRPDLVGEIAGTLIKSLKTSYISIGIDRKYYKSHRLAFLYMTGEFPKFLVDHKDRDGTNNKWLNIRAASTYENSTNKEVYKNNTSGFKGISLDKKSGKWRAYVCHQKKQYHLGLFIDIKDATKAVRLKRIELHGEFANHG